MSIAEAMDRMNTPADPHTGNNGNTSPADTLRVEFGACAVSFTPWLGTSKTLTVDQKDQAAREFGAEGKSLSAGKKLLNTKHERFRAVTAIKTNTRKEWERVSLPYPDPGVRLIRQESVGPFQDYIDRARNQLDRAVDDLDAVFWDLKQDARRRLGDLYNPADYPETLRGLFGLEVSFPSIEPPDYLRQLRPDVYEAERARIAARFDEAVAMAEESFTSELADMVGHLVDCLTRRGEDGRPKTFKNSAVGNLREFFERFQSLSVRSNPELDRLVESAQTAIANANPGRLRGEPIFRQSVADRLAPVQSALADMMESAPRRNIIRRPPR